MTGGSVRRYWTVSSPSGHVEYADATDNPYLQKAWTGTMRPADTNDNNDHDGQ